MSLLEPVGVHVQKDTHTIRGKGGVKDVNVQKEAEQGLLIALALLHCSGCGVGRSHAVVLLKSSSLYWEL